MLGKSPIQTTPQIELFRSLLASFINLNQDLIHLGSQLDWQGLETHFTPLYSATGTPSKPIRLMVGLLILKQLYNLSDEKVVEAWVQNPYYQHFTGEVFLVGSSLATLRFGTFSPSNWSTGGTKDF